MLCSQCCCASPVCWLCSVGPQGDSHNWVLYGFKGKTNALELVGSGTGGLSELQVTLSCLPATKLRLLLMLVGFLCNTFSQKWVFLVVCLTLCVCVLDRATWPTTA